MFWKQLRTKFSILFYFIFYIFDIFSTWVASVKTACWWLTVLKNRRYVLAFQTGIRSKIAFYASAQHSKDDGCAQTATPHISLPEYAHNTPRTLLERSCRGLSNHVRCPLVLLVLSVQICALRHSISFLLSKLCGGQV